MAAARTLVTFADRLVLYVLVGFEHVVVLGSENTVEVEGPLGTTVIEVAGGAARVLSSPCPHQVCVKMGAVDSPGRSVVCVPNRVVVTMVGDGPTATDAVTK